MPTTSGRLLSLLTMLQARRDWPGRLLAERLAVSPRTVRRDVDRLRDLGYPIAAIKGPDGGYRLEAGTQLPPLLFDDEQAVALAVALRLATAAGAGVEDAAARALVTIRQVMPSRLRGRIDAVEVTAVARSGGDGARIESGVLAALGAAVHAREVVRFDYTPAPFSGPAPDGPPRRVEPHHLVAWGDRWYLVAWDLDRDDWRTFRVDRISPRTPNGPRFTARALPGGDVSTFMHSRFRGSTDDTGRWPCEGEVIVDSPAGDIAPYCRDGVVEPLGDERCRLVLGGWSWTGLAARIGYLDADVEVVGPAELRLAFGALARRYADAGRPVDLNTG